MNIFLRLFLKIKDIKNRKYKKCSNQNLVGQILAINKRTYAGECELKELLGLLTKENYSSSKEILELFGDLSDRYLSFFLDYFPTNKFFRFIEEIKLVRMMEYYLTQHDFCKFFLISKKIRPKTLYIWYDVNFEKISEIINISIWQYTYSVFHVFLSMDAETLERYYTSIRHMDKLEKSIYRQYINLLEEGMTLTDYIDNPFFIQQFTKMDLSSQIYLAELMEGNDFDRTLIDKLHKFLNKRWPITQDYFYKNVFEMSKQKFIKVLTAILHSSYFHKSDVKNQQLWKSITLNEYSSENSIQDTYSKVMHLDVTEYPIIWNIVTEANYDKIDSSFDYYSQIMDLYEKCRDYATESIVNSLYPLNTLTEKVTYLKGKFNVLARVRTLWEAKDLYVTFQVRDFCSFSTLNEKNVSHYGDSVLYGYYTGVVPKLIAHIFPCDSLSKAGARFRNRITKAPNWFLDIDDLNTITYRKKTYNQLCIATKNQGEILKPDCIICIEKVDEQSQKAADEMGLNILVLPKMEDTIENNEDIYSDLK